jgi:excisionase family DNA binding protein
MSGPNTLRELQRWAENAPPGTLIAADALARSLAELEAGGDSLPDLTVEEVGRELNRSPSTIRGWLGSGKLRGYRMNGREWRVPRAAVREYLEGQRNGGGCARASRSRGQQADLAAWRQARQ